MFRSLAVLVVLLMSAPSLSAQYVGTVQIIPQIADGTASDGSYYTSQIVVSRQTNNETTCQIYFTGVPISRLNGANPFSFATSSYSTGTNNGGTLASGYGLVECNNAVSVNTVYTYFVNGQIQSMATVFCQNNPTYPTSAFFSSGIISQWMDLPDTRIGIAIANSSASTATVTVTDYLPNGAAQSVNLTLPPQTSSAQFIDQLISGLPTGSVYSVIGIVSNVPIAATGLYYIGPIFTTIPMTIFY